MNQPEKQSLRRRLRFILPAINIVIAIPLLILGYVRFAYGSRNPYPSELLACYLITVPATFLRYLGTHLLGKTIPVLCSTANLNVCYHVEHFADPCVFLLAVCTVWYVVGLEIDTKGQKKRAIVPSRTSLRVIVDVVLILIGVFLAFAALSHQARQPDTVIWAVLQILSFAAWALAIVVAYGHDLVRSIVQWRQGA